MNIKLLTAIFTVMLAGLFLMTSVSSAAAPKCAGLKKKACLNNPKCKWVKGQRDAKTKKLIKKGRCVAKKKARR